MISIGFSNYINKNKILVISSFESAPIKRMVQNAKEQGKLIDVTFGRKTRSVIFLNNGQIVASALQSETLSQRFDGIKNIKNDIESEEDL